jgi:uncharacterized LabA/DUF88 family protein
MAWHSSRPTPHYKKTMVFVDGSNLLIELAKKIDIPFRGDKPPTSVLNFASFIIDRVVRGADLVKIRKFWFASYQGNEEYETKLCRHLRGLGFEPVLFKKRNGKEKGVDISLTMKVLLNAINQNYDIAYMVAGDEDYLGLVKEVKRYGQIIYGSFFSQGLSERLELEFDAFTNLDSIASHIDSEPFLEAIKKEFKS